MSLCTNCTADYKENDLHLCYGYMGIERCACTNDECVEDREYLFPRDEENAPES